MPIRFGAAIDPPPRRPSRTPGSTAELPKKGETEDLDAPCHKNVLMVYHLFRRLAKAAKTQLNYRKPSKVLPRL